jgi:predicted component of type VI protein secretion system
MNFKISSFLPPVVQENFSNLLAGYLGSIYEALKSYNQRMANKSSQSSQPDAKDVESVMTFTQNLVSGELTEQLMR